MSGSTSYAVNARLNITGNADAVLAKIGQRLGALDARIKATQSALNSLTGAFTSASGAMGMVARGGALASQAMTLLRQQSAQASQAAQGITRSANSSAAALSRQAAQATHAATAMRALSSVAPPPRVRGGGGGGGGGGRGGRRHTDFGEMHGASVAAGIGTHFLKQVFEAASGVESQRARLLIGGTTSGTAETAGRVSVEEANAITARARQVALAVPGTTMEQNIAMMGELRSVLGDVHEAMDFAKPFAEIGRMVHLLTGRSTEGIGLNLMKALERQGAIMTRDPATGEAHVDRAKMDQMLRLISQGIAGTHGRVDDRQLINFMQTGALPAAMMSPEGFLGNVFPMAFAMGGHQGGTAYQAMMRAWTGSQITRPAMEESARFGLIDKRHVTVARGGKVTLGEGAVPGLEQMQNDPLMWVRDHLNPALQQHGIDPLNPAHRGKLVQALTRMTGQQVHARALAELSMELPRLLRERAQWMRTAPDMPGVIMGASPTQATEGVTAALNTFLATMGSPQMGTTLNMMNRLTEGLNRLSGWAEANPAIAGDMIALAGWLTGLAAAGAAFAVGSMAVGGLVSAASGLTALAVAVASPAFLVGGAVFVLGAGIGALGLALSGYSWADMLGSLTNGLANLRRLLNLQSPDTGGAGPGATGNPFGGGAIGGQLGRIIQGTVQPGEEPADLSLGMGYGVGRWLRRRWDAPRPEANPEAVPPPASWGGGFRLNNFSPIPGAGGDAVLRTVINIDGREIADVVSRHQGRTANAPPAGARGFDFRRGGYGPEPRTRSI